MTIELPLVLQLCLLLMKLLNSSKIIKQQVRKITWKHKHSGKMPWRLHFFIHGKCDDDLANEMTEDFIFFIYYQIGKIEVDEEEAKEAAYRYMSRLVRIVRQIDDDEKSAYFAKYKKYPISDVFDMQRYSGLQIV